MWLEVGKTEDCMMDVMYQGARGRRNRAQYHIIMHILLQLSVTAHSAEVQTGLMLIIVCLAWSIRI